MSLFYKVSLNEGDSERRIGFNKVRRHLAYSLIVLPALVQSWFIVIFSLSFSVDLSLNV